ncbi:MAG: D-lysine 5,6-aminomutase subunit alpha [Firmicutes bacterium]|nr:D-lysine 5,6-aminomutase subunit alpha [Bacillota bacterium]
MNQLLQLDSEKVETARKLASSIAFKVQEDINRHTTVSIERTVARLFGIDGTDQHGVPLANVVVDQLAGAKVLERGVAPWLANAVVALDKPPQQIAEACALGLRIFSLEWQEPDKVSKVMELYTDQALKRIKDQRRAREEWKARLGIGKEPLKYVIVASGNIFEDVEQAKSAARQGADIIAVIRTTGQSLLDYVPYGTTTEGFGGTYATQANFRVMRLALDEVSEEVGRYIQLVNYCSGLCMPEIAAMGALERLDMMLNDAMYGILFRDINMDRTFADQYFSRMINAYAGIIINTGEDNYLTTADAFEQAHTVLASNFINEQMGLAAGLENWQLGLGHAFELDPKMKNGFLYELALAQTIRQVFPEAPLKYMPPTKHMTGDIFMGHVQNAMFNLASVLTGQSIHLLGMLTEAIHTPHLSDRSLSIDNARYVMENARDLGKEISFKPDGIIQRRSEEILNRVVDFLTEIDLKGLKNAISEGYFADIKRPQNGGKGGEGVFCKGFDYRNPFMEKMQQALGIKSSLERGGTRD